MVKIRKATNKDLNFVLSATLKTLRSSGNNKFMRTEYFYKLHNDPIEKLIRASNILLAVNENEPDFIQGFLIANDNTVIYAYTRKAMRRMGVFKELFKNHFGEWKAKHNCLFINNIYASIFGKKTEYRPRG